MWSRLLIQFFNMADRGCMNTGAGKMQFFDAQKSLCSSRNSVFHLVGIILLSHGIPCASLVNLENLSHHILNVVGACFFPFL